MASQAIDINGDEDEDAAFERAVFMSLQEAGETKVRSMSETFQDVPSAAVAEMKPATAPATSANPLAALGLDRRKMEEERLARARKRKVDEVVAVHEDEVRPAPALRSTMKPQNSTASHQPPPTSLSNPIATAVSSSTIRNTLPFPKGIVKRTFCRGQPRKDDITIEEVLQKEQLELAVLSSYQWDDEWLMKKVDARRTKMVLIAYARDEATKAAMIANVPGDVIRFCFPRMNGYGAMHSKLMLLKYPGYLRIVVPTGNLVPEDWGETGHLENMLFLIDLPRLPKDARNKPLTPFGEELSWFLTAQGLDDKLVQSLKNYDFAETAKYGFVHTSVCTRLEDYTRTGYGCLGRTVAGLGLASGGGIEVDYASSSIGALKGDLILALYNTLQGDAGTKAFQKSTTRLASNGRHPRFSLDDQFRIYYPSKDTVRASIGREPGAGTICMSSSSWMSDSFPRAALRDYQNNRKGVLMHTKLILVRHTEPKDRSDDKASGFVYVGSANLSESAWGRLITDKPTGKPRMTCRNWECGVIIPVYGHAATESAEGRNMMDIFRDVVPVPIEVPGRPYQDQEPWFNTSG